MFILRPAIWAQDTAWLPAGKQLDNGTIIPSTMSYRSMFTDYLGTYVWHCHRLLHEDSGLMTVVNVIPSITIYSVATIGHSSRDSSVQVFNEKGTK